MKKFLEFINENLSDDSIKIYHTTESKSDAESILANGFDINISRRFRNEGIGMGAFFVPNPTGTYGKYCIEFGISKEDFRNYILIDTDEHQVYRNGNYIYVPNDLTEEFCKKIHGYVKSVEDQIKDIDIALYNRVNFDELINNFGNNPMEFDKGKIKGLVQTGRFFILSIHLYDPSIAKPLRIIELKTN